MSSPSRTAKGWPALGQDRSQGQHPYNIPPVLQQFSLPSAPRSPALQALHLAFSGWRVSNNSLSVLP